MIDEDYMRPAPDRPSTARRVLARLTPESKTSRALLVAAAVLFVVLVVGGLVASA